VLIEIYSKDLCPHCVDAKLIFSSLDVDWVEYNIELDADKKSEMTRRSKGRRTVPQIFIDGVHVGGCDDLKAAQRSGRLDELLAPRQ